MKKLTIIAFLTLAISTSRISHLLADSFTLTAQATDAQVNPQYISNANGVADRMGLYTTGGFGQNVVYPFAIPEIPFGDTITGASFSLNLSSKTGSFVFNGDLYYLGTSTSNAVSTSDYFNGAYGTDPHAAAIQQYFVTPTTPLGRVSASPAANNAIAAMLQAQVDAGATAGYYFFLRLSPDFTGTPTSKNVGYNMSMTGDVLANQPSLNCTATFTTAPPTQMGRVLWEYWTGLPNGSDSGVSLGDLTSSPNYPNHPTAREYPTVMEIPANLDTQSGDRMRGYFYPPVSGYYTFAIASDDNSILMLSTDNTPAHAVTIASVTGNTTYHQWNKYPTQTSAPINLTVGNAYYIEAQHKQGTDGNSNVSIGYTPPNGSGITLMPATNVAPYDAGASYTPGAISPVLTSAHPRIMLSPAAIARLRAAIAVPGSLQATWWASIQTQANTYLAAPVTVPAAGTPLVNIVQPLQDTIYYLSLDYLLNSNVTIQTNCLNKIYALLQSAANWGGTNNNTAPGNWAEQQLLDVPVITVAYAIAYDWCFAGWTPTQKALLLSTIQTNGFGPMAADGPPNWTGGLLNGSTNQTISIDSGYALAALAILGDETGTPQAPGALDELLPALYSSPAMAGFAPDGASPEAECYGGWDIRTFGAFLSSLETSSATCFTFDQLSGAPSMGSYELYEIGPLGKTINYGDEDTDGCNEGSQGNIPVNQYLGLKYNEPVYSWRQQQNATNPTIINPTWTPYPLDLVWCDPRGTTASPQSLNIPPSFWFQGAGIISLRNAWNNPNALFAGLKAGTNNADHTSLQIGSFVFDALGVRWASMLGRDSYSLPEYFSLNAQNDQHGTTSRFSYYRCRAEGCNTLVINPGWDGGQAVKVGSVTEVSTVTNFKSTTTPTNTQQAIIDMSPQYIHNAAGQSTPVTSAKRGMRLFNVTAQVQDEVTASAAVDVNWFMHTQTTISGQGTNTVTLTPATGTSRLQMVIQSPSGAVFKSMAATPLPGSPDYTAFQSSPPSDGENKNAGFTKLWIELPSTTTTTLTVALCPYTQGSTPPPPPPVNPLSSW